MFNNINIKKYNKYWKSVCGIINKNNTEAQAMSLISSSHHHLSTTVSKQSIILQKKHPSVCDMAHKHNVNPCKHFSFMMLS